MKQVADRDITLLLDECGYNMTSIDGTLTVKKKSPSIPFFPIILISLGVIFVISTAAMSMEIHYAVFGILLIGFPFVYERWKYPRQIIIDGNRGVLRLKTGMIHEKNYPLSEISSLVVDESIIDSDVSPFKDGYQDFIYNFQLKVGKTKLKLMYLMFRKSNDEEIKEIVDFLSEKLRIKA